MNDSSLKHLFDGFNNVTALVIGDVMVDSYLWGRVDRISPEAPVPVVQITKKENRLENHFAVGMLGNIVFFKIFVHPFCDC